MRLSFVRWFEKKKYKQTRNKHQGQEGQRCALFFLAIVTRGVSKLTANGSPMDGRTEHFIERAMPILKKKKRHEGKPYN
jgi:hypothetical protein